MIPFDAQPLVKQFCLSSGLYRVSMLYVILVLQNLLQLNECKMLLKSTRRVFGFVKRHPMQKTAFRHSCFVFVSGL